MGEMENLNFARQFYCRSQALSFPLNSHTVWVIKETDRQITSHTFCILACLPCGYELNLFLSLSLLVLRCYHKHETANKRKLREFNGKNIQLKTFEPFDFYNTRPGGKREEEKKNNNNSNRWSYFIWILFINQCRSVYL